MATNDQDDHERAAAGLDFDFPMREKAASLGQKVAENGPEALLDEIENLLPEAWRDQITNFPIVAMILGVGVGVFLGMKKGDEIIAAGGSLLSAAAISNVTQAMERAVGGSND
jgi:hypothetical protein